MSLHTQMPLLLAESAPVSPPSPYFWMPRPGSTLAGDTDWLFHLMLYISTAAAVAIIAVMVYFLFRYRAKARKENELADKSSDHNTALEITWSIVPLFIVMALFVWGFKGFVNLRTPPRDAMEIQVTGQKWKWLFTYSNGHVDDVLHVPQGRPVRLVINSVDVIHSLYIPAFRLKMDAVPGRFSDLWFEATEPGSFPVFCAEYCGTAHSGMITRVEVHEANGYEKWLDDAAKEGAGGSPAAVGQKLYDQRCAVCHTNDGTPRIGPTFKGMWGKTEELTEGGPVKVDENYVRESILEPQAKVVKGFSPSMPTFKGQLSDQQINQIIEYLKSVK